MNWIKRVLRPEQIREFSLVLLIIAAIFFFSSQIDNYLTARTFNRVASSAAILVVIAVGQTLVVLTRNIDLSVGSIVGFTAYFVGSQLALNNELSPVLAVLLSVGVGTVMGVINGIIVAYGRVPAIITTLGTLAIYRTLLIQYSDSKTVTANSLPMWLQDLPRANLFTIGDFDIRLVVGIAIAVVLLFQLVLSYLAYGRRLYALGSNPEAAAMAGLPAQRTLMTAYALCGALCGIAGFLFLARFGNITVVAGQGLELQSVAAVVVGGVNIFGGTGTMFGALLGTVLISTLEQSLLRWAQISEFWRDAILGLLILFAIATDAVIISRLRAWWAHNPMRGRIYE